MADVELVIKIPEEEYNAIKKSNAPMTWLEHLIKKGTPLPQWHGKIIDESQIEEVYTQTTEERYIKGEIIAPRIEIIGTNAPTIIEAVEK